MKKLIFNPDKDMKELEKYGFYECLKGMAYTYDIKNGGVYIGKEDREVAISPRYDVDIYDLAILYDLIKANLLIVEEVDK